MQNLKFVSSAVPEILGSHNLKVGHVTKAKPPIGKYFIFCLVSLTINRMQNLKFVSSAVPEILGGPNIWKVGHMT